VVSRRVVSGLPVNAVIPNGSPYSFKTPSQAHYYTTPLDSSVKYAGGNPKDIQSVLAHICDKSTLGNTLIVLKDLHDPQRPLFLITTLTSRFFPRGNWQAYLYLNRYPDPFDYHLVAKLTITIEPNLIPSWQTWRFLSRLFREQSGISKPRNHRNHEGLGIHQDTLTIAPVC